MTKKKTITKHSEVINIQLKKAQWSPKHGRSKKVNDKVKNEEQDNQGNTKLKRTILIDGQTYSLCGILQQAGGSSNWGHYNYVAVNPNTGLARLLSDTYTPDSVTQESLKYRFETSYVTCWVRTG